MVLALIGVINSAVPFSLFAWAAQRAPAGIGAITNSMTVLFTALVAFLFYGERIGKRRAVALFAVAWAWLMLGEPLTGTMLSAGALILGSVALSQRQSA